MKIRFLQNVDISGKLTLFKGDIFEARDEGDVIMIRMADDSTVVAPKNEIDGILEIIE